MDAASRPTTLLISRFAYAKPGLNNNNRNSTTQTTQENQDRMIAAEVLMKFSQSSSDSKSEEEDEEQTKPKDITDTESVSGGSSSDNTITSKNNNNIKKTMSTSGDINNSIITVTTTTTTDSVDNVNILQSGIKPLLTPVVNFCNSSKSGFSGIPRSFSNQQQQQQRKLMDVDDCCFTRNITKLFAERPVIWDNPIIFPTKHNSEPLEQQVDRLTCHEKQIEVSHERFFPSPTQPNTGTNNTNNESQHYKINNNSPTINNNNNNNNSNQRKKSLPVYNARILKALLNSKNNSKLVYLIHPYNDTFLIWSINKYDFIVSYLQLRHRLSGTDQVFNKPQISDTDLLATQEKHVWGVLKNDVSIQFFEAATPKESKNLNITNKNINNNNVITAEQTQENNTCGSSNNESDKFVGSSPPTIEPQPPLVTTEKLESTLPLKKRKVADSLLTPYSRTPSPTSVAQETYSATSIKSVSQLAEDCIKDRSVFIISPSDVPKIVKSVSITPRDDNNTNQKLTQSIDIALRQDKDGDLPLHIATVQKDLKMVGVFGMLIQRAGKSVDRFNKKNLTPLHLCVKVKFHEGLKKLIEMGADVNSLDGNGRSALHIAVVNSDFATFDFMLSQCAALYVNDPKMKANLNSHDYEGLTLLHTAVNNKNIKLIEKLLEEGAELDSIDFKSGRTPLFHAVESNNMDIVEFLLEKKASVDIPNFAGNTAFLAAYARGYHDISKLLAENGADTRGLLPIEEFTSSNLKTTTSAVKSQLKNKLVEFSSFSDLNGKEKTDHQAI